MRHATLWIMLAGLALAAGCKNRGDQPAPKRVATIDAVVPGESDDKGEKGQGIVVGEPAAEDVKAAEVDAGAPVSMEELARHQTKIHAISVRPEETLLLYSEWSGVTTNDLKLQNNGKFPVYGKKYYIPLSLAELENFQQRREEYWHQKVQELYKRYKVIPGKYAIQKNDTLLGVAKRHKAPMWFIVHLNQNLDPLHLSVGQQLMVPTLVEKEGDELTDSATHVGGEGDQSSGFEVRVRPGESAYLYAKWAGIKVEDIKKSNRHIKNLNKLRVGDRIKLPLTAKQMKEFLEKRDGKKKRKKKKKKKTEKK